MPADSDISRDTRAAYEYGYRSDRLGNIIAPGGTIKKLRKESGPRRGYYTFSIGLRAADRKSRARNVRVHKFVAFEKFGEKSFEAGVHVRHLNGNPLDNSWDNIEIGTAHENIMDRDPNKRLEHSRKASSALRRMPDKDVLKVLLRRAQGASYSDLTKEFGLSGSHLSYLFNKSRYAAKISEENGLATRPITGP